jgi:hypothetical protein
MAYVALSLLFVKFSYMCAEKKAPFTFLTAETTKAICIFLTFVIPIAIIAHFLFLKSLRKALLENKS